MTQLRDNNIKIKSRDRLPRSSPLGRGGRLGTHPDPGLCEVGPHGYLLPRAHVRVAVALESGLQFLQLLAGEVGPLPPLPLLLGRVVRRVVVLVLYLFFLCKGGRTARFREGVKGSPGGGERDLRAPRRRGSGGDKGEGWLGRKFVDR